MTVKELAQYINKSESFIYHRINKIPHHRIGESLVFIKSEIDEWIKNSRSTKEKNENTEQSHKKAKILRHFIFKEQYLAILTDAFIQEGYIDKDNADLMRDRFSIKPKEIIIKIIWRGNLKSLVSFAFLSDRLDFIDKENTIGTNFRVHNTSAKEEKENEDEIMKNKEVLYSKLLNNFSVSNEYGFSESELNREWTDINEAIIKLRQEILRNKIGRNFITEEFPEDMTRKKAIITYFKNKGQKSFKLDNRIDKKIFDLFYKTWQGLEN
jgi:excisionase family DNA binding protein